MRKISTIALVYMLSLILSPSADTIPQTKALQIPYQVQQTLPLPQKQSSPVTDSTRSIMTRQNLLQSKLQTLRNELNRTRSSLDSLKSKKQQADTLQRDAATPQKGFEISLETEKSHEKVDEAIERLEEKIEKINEKIEETIEQSKEAETERIETVYENQRHPGGAFVLAPQIQFIDNGPIKTICLGEHDLKKRTFHFSGRSGFNLAFLGYYDLGNGFRIGNELAFGYKRFRSDIYSDSLFDSLQKKNILVDSMVNLRVIPMHIGLICEKAYYYPFGNVYGGFMAGLATLVVVKNAERLSNGSAFINQSEASSDSAYSFAYAPQLIADLHIGTAVAMAQYFTVGVEAVLQCAYAPEGFISSEYGDFITVTPGIRIRMAFGNR
ncbi:MAG: hypothetical protein JW795_22400 [Chitinivibrionales bacterium]|nr:hypothetical protein [Chitinivibrionales bacterium]